MNNANRLNEANELINSLSGNENLEVKRVKKDNGLIERVDLKNKVILAEDNRQVIFG